MIKQNILDKISESLKCKAELQIALNKSSLTISRYISDNDIMLTTDAALNVIEAFTKLKREEILVQKEPVQ